MPKFVIERELIRAGKLPPQELKAMSQKPCGVLQHFVTDHKIYCVYIAPDEQSVRQHVEKAGFPANAVARVRCVIDPTTAEH